MIDDSGIVVLASVQEGAWLRLAKQQQDCQPQSSPRRIEPQLAVTSRADLDSPKALGTISNVRIAPKGKIWPESPPSDLVVMAPEDSAAARDGLDEAAWMLSLREPQISLSSQRQIRRQSGHRCTPKITDKGHCSPTKGRSGEVKSVADRCVEFMVKREEELAEARRRLAEAELKGCTFSPKTNKRALTPTREAIKSPSRGRRHDDLYRAHAVSLLKKETRAMEAAQQVPAACTFSPTVNKPHASCSPFRTKDHFRDWEASRKVHLDQLRREAEAKDLSELKKAPAIAPGSKLVARRLDREGAVEDRLTKAGREMELRAKLLQSLEDERAKTNADVRLHIAESDAHCDVSAERSISSSVHERLYQEAVERTEDAKVPPPPTASFHPTISVKTQQLIGSAIPRSSTPIFERLIAEGVELSARRQREALHQHQQQQASRDASPSAPSKARDAAAAARADAASVASLRRSFTTEESTPPPNMFSPSISLVSRVIDASRTPQGTDRGTYLIEMHTERERQAAKRRGTEAAEKMEEQELLESRKAQGTISTPVDVQQADEIFQRQEAWRRRVEGNVARVREELEQRRASELTFHPQVNGTYIVQ